MTGSQATTFSPSSSTIRRRTPWVLGCCGPMLRSRFGSATAAGSVDSAGLVAATPHRFLPLLRVDAKLDRLRWWLEILAQGVDLPVVRVQDPFEVGMVREPDSEH